MDEQKHPHTESAEDTRQESRPVDEARRALGRAGLAAPVVLATLASRPVLGATCLTPSAAGSGNHSQHNPIETGCTPQSPQWWIENAPTKTLGNGSVVVDENATWTNTPYKPKDPFHPTFSKGTYLNFSSNPAGTQSYSLWEVLNGTTPNAPAPGPTGLGKWFVAGLLNAASTPNKYGGVIQAIGPDPSVRGIEDEYARLGYFVPTAGKKWDDPYVGTIIAYLSNPGSVF